VVPYSRRDRGEQQGKDGRRALAALFDQLGQAVGAILAQPVVRILALIVSGYVVVVWLAVALWAFNDMRRRTVNLIWPYVSAGIVIVASPLLFPLALVVHKIVRPATTVAERRLSRLRDVALAVELDEPHCRLCGRPVDEAWLVCPSCRTQLGHLCDQCGRSVGLDWDACPWCGSLLAARAGLLAQR
jgi:RNA polymerase subunit RPABC4/transcription elongation factor Spt4